MQAGQVRQMTPSHMHDRAARTSGWTSGNSSVVSINNTGYMIARKAGETYISVELTESARGLK